MNTSLSSSIINNNNNNSASSSQEELFLAKLKSTSNNVSSKSASISALNNNNDKNTINQHPNNSHHPNNHESQFSKDQHQNQREVHLKPQTNINKLIKSSNQTHYSTSHLSQMDNNNQTKNTDNQNQQQNSSTKNHYQNQLQSQHFSSRNLQQADMKQQPINVNMNMSKSASTIINLNGSQSPASGVALERSDSPKQHQMIVDRSDSTSLPSSSGSTSDESMFRRRMRWVGIALKIFSLLLSLIIDANQTLVMIQFVIMM